MLNRFSYRLGLCGFLAGKDMQSSGFLANRGLKDQRMALQWVKKHIGGFGGNPENVTVMGQSAGSSMWIHSWKQHCR